MDDINSFFSMNGSFKREEVSAGSVAGRVVPKFEAKKAIKRETFGTSYGDAYRKAQLEDMKEMAKLELTHDKLPLYQSTVDDMEMDSDMGDVKTECIDDVYNRYKFNRTLPDLPIIEMKDHILNVIEKNEIVVLEGATGCGKTTQVPQFILDDGYARGKSVNIVVTQPRRLAAVSIANRVAVERGLPKTLPHLIGYQIGLKTMTNDDTRITFCTTGVLLEKLIATHTLTNYTHIILDEVHERTQDMDFLFIVVKNLRRSARHVRIILMSATIEAADFADYFKFFRDESSGVPAPAPILKVEKLSNFKINTWFLDEFAEKLNVNTSVAFNLDHPTIDEEIYLAAVKLIHIADRIDITDKLPSDIKPTILIFLPGIYEISCLNKHIEESARQMQRENDLMVGILHSQITHDQQVFALRPPPAGKRMILLATNIAESSITVPDVKYVIDFCLSKSLITDTTTNFTSLQMEWCSRNNCRQRAGRTGRTMDGRVYRLVPKFFYEDQMDDSSRPEMCRAPLENIVLKAKLLQMGAPCIPLSLAMSPPTLEDIRNTILLLKESGALLRTSNGSFDDDDGDMTLIGHVMAALPVNIRVAKLIVLGHCFSVLSECIIIGAGLTTKSIFMQGFTKSVKFYSKKLVWSDGSGSDLFAILKAYTAYVEIKKINLVSTKTWAERCLLNERSLNEMSDLVAEITQRLDRFGIKERTGVHRAKWSSAEKSIILKVVIAGAFYPNYFVRSTEETGSRETFRAINGRNPCNTVFFTGFPEKYVRPLYTESIKKMLMPCTNSPENIQVTFDEGNEKVFVSFKQNGTSMQKNYFTDLDCVEKGPGQVCIEVYKALKMRKRFDLRVMHPRDAQIYAEEMKFGSVVKGKWQSNKKTVPNISMVCLPRKKVRAVDGIITHYDKDLNRFWLRPVDEQSLFDEIQTVLNSLDRDMEEFTNYGDVSVGQVVAVAYKGDYYRAQILLPIRGTNNVYYKILLMDIGLEDQVELSQLRRLRGMSARYNDIPPRVFQCRLASIQPSELHSHRHEWSSIMTEFKKLTKGDTINARIYSVENGVASVFIDIGDRTVQDILIAEGFGKTADESFMSIGDHIMRKQIQERTATRHNDDEQLDAIEQEIRNMMTCEEECTVTEPANNLRHIVVPLNGPKSPFEVSIYSCLHTATSKKVVVEPHSVNSILLEANPQDPFEKYVVAANVTESQNKSELTARETSIMPNIPGFGPLMALLFSPYCEFFRDRYKSRYVAILCGLGQHPVTNESMYSEHDVRLNLDADIGVEDIQNINLIRFLMDNLLKMRSDQKHTNLAEHNLNQSTVRLKDAIIELLEKERPLMGIQFDYDVGWSKYPPGDVVKGVDVFGSSAIFPSHNILTLSADDSPERLDQVQNLIENNKALHRMVQIDVSWVRAEKCLLCHLELESVSELKIHLYSRLHRDREQKISRVNC